jgi:hypothetical protein
MASYSPCAVTHHGELLTTPKLIANCGKKLKKTLAKKSTRANKKILPLPEQEDKNATKNDG